MVKAPIVLTGPPEQCILHAYPNFISSEDCDALHKLATEKAAFRERGCRSAGISPTDEGLTPQQARAIATFEAQVSEVTGCAWHPREGVANFKVTAPTKGSSDHDLDASSCDSSSSESEDPEEGRFHKGLHVVSPILTPEPTTVSPPYPAGHSQ